MADNQSVSGVGGVSGDPSRQGGLAGRQRPRAKAPDSPGSGNPTSQADADYDARQAAAADPTAALVEALDRLRATAELCPVEVELMRAMRGARIYQEESRHGLPVIPDPEAPPPAPPGEAEQPPDQG